VRRPAGSQRLDVLRQRTEPVTEQLQEHHPVLFVRCRTGGASAAAHPTSKTGASSLRARNQTSLARCLPISAPVSGRDLTHVGGGRTEGMAAATLLRRPPPGSGRAVQAGAAADWSEACERRAFQAALAHNPRLSSRGTITCSAVSWNRPRARPGQSFCLLIGVALGGGHWTDTGLSNETDVWESKRFPVAAATLKRRAPAVYAWMFR
jgi:hypothetical protein